jgi:hypothetical protein
MRKRLDKPNYRIHKKCHDCVILFEHKLQIKGQLVDYKNSLQAKNSVSYINELESYLLDAVNTSTSGYVTENGEIEKWAGGFNKDKIVKDIVNNSKIARKNIKKKFNV